MAAKIEFPSFPAGFAGAENMQSHILMKLVEASVIETVCLYAFHLTTATALNSAIMHRRRFYFGFDDAFGNTALKKMLTYKACC